MIINKKKIEMPIPLIKSRILNEVTYKKSLFAEIPPLQAKIIANRNIPHFIEPKSIFKPSLDGLDVYKIKDIKKSADRIADGIIKKETIALLCDFDVDGISSAAVLYSSLIKYFKCDPQNIKVMISNRMKSGYGFSQDVLNEVIETTPTPTLLITADQGSKDDERITAFKNIMEDRGIKGACTIVTDHHHVSGSGPQDAYATVNPQRHDCEFKDKTICGCTVALFVMYAVRDSLIEKGYLQSDAPELTDLLTYSTSATIADCVSMASPFNRAIVIRGLTDMNAGTKAPWRVMRNLFSDPSQPLRTDSIGFGLGPRINACSRTGGDGLVALKFYMSESDFEAERFLSMLDYQNDDRKAIEKKLVDYALMSASDYYIQGSNCLVLYLEDGHHGVHGIVASRICERYGRPVICISPKEYDIELIDVDNDSSSTLKKKKKIEKKTVYTVSGSARSIEGIDIHECMEKASKKHPDLFLGFGGHSMAAGMGLKVENIDLLRNAIEFEVTEMLNGEKPHPVILVDGELKSNFTIDLKFIDEILKLEPYGNGFEYPTFKIQAQIQSIEIKGKNKDTGIMNIIFGNNVYKAVWFKYNQSPMFNKVKNGDICDMAISIREQFWNGRRQISIQVIHANPS